MAEPATHRLTWEDLPPAVHVRVELLLGSPVAATRTAVGGFSRSTASIVTAANGRSVFVKAVTAEVNAGSMALNRDEARHLARLPEEIPAPMLRDAFEEGPWFVVVIDAIPGTTPREPWTAADLDAVLATLDDLQRVGTPTPLVGTPSVADALGPDLRGFERVLADVPADLDDWLCPRRESLARAAARGIAPLDGDTLCHSDLRADNVLIRPDGSVVLVDWAWASRGSRFADALQFLSSIEDPHGRLDLDGRIDAVMDRHGVPREVATDVLIGILGFFVDAARWPWDPSLPTLLEHRATMRDRLLSLVRRRWEAEDRDRHG